MAAGVEIDYAATFFRTMITGASPQVAPDVMRVPEYAPISAASPLTVRAYVGTPIVQPDGDLLGTVCGYSPGPRPESLREHEPLLALLSSLLASVLEAQVR
jgi:GAF domain-containing protein